MNPGPLPHDPPNAPLAQIAHAQLLLSTAGLLRLDAPLADASSTLSPGSLLLDVHPSAPGSRLRLLAAGPPSLVDAHPGSSAARHATLPDVLLIPGLVNAHCHLDLTSVGPRPFDPAAGFMGPGGFVDVVRRERPVEPDAIRAAVRLGARLSRDGGVVAVGDIAGAPAGRPSLHAIDALAETGLRGVGFIEFFGIGASEARALALLPDLARQAAAFAHRPVVGGLQPHAPNTVSPRVYREAARLARVHHLPLSTHLAETPDEREFIARAAGPQRDFLARLGLWDDALLRDIGHGRSPIAHLADSLAPVWADSPPRPPLILAHVNDLGGDARLLADLGATVAYCPRASEYFQAARHFGPHPYRALLAAGVAVALGTDSIINLPSGSTRLSTWDEMAMLLRRDGTPPSDLLRMATTHGARALGLPVDEYQFGPGADLAGIVAITTPAANLRNAPDPLAFALKNEVQTHLLADGFSAGDV